MSITLVTLCGSALVAQRTPAREPRKRRHRRSRRPRGAIPICRASGTRRPGHRSNARTNTRAGQLLTDAEAAERERLRFAEFDEEGRAGGTGDYGSVWREQSKNALNRTALIIEPEDGKIPPLTPAGPQDLEARTRARRARGEADSWHDRSLWERCITRGTPRIPNNYNSNWHILQTEQHVVILQEMIHETRIIPLDGRRSRGGNGAPMARRFARPLGQRHAGRRDHQLQRQGGVQRVCAATTPASSSGSVALARIGWTTSSPSTTRPSTPDRGPCRCRSFWAPVTSSTRATRGTTGCRTSSQAPERRIRSLSSVRRRDGDPVCLLLGARLLTSLEASTRPLARPPGTSLYGGLNAIGSFGQALSSSAVYQEVRCHAFNAFAS